jgi:Colicin V production protein
MTGKMNSHIQISVPPLASPPPGMDAADGSPLWQLVFLSFAIALLLFEILRGWRRGAARQFTRLGALFAAYFAGLFGAKFVAPLWRPFLKLPDALLVILAGAVLALAFYVVINALGTVLFKRTRQHESALMRLLSGTGGAVLGLFFGLFFVWILVVGVRSLGAVANGEVREQSASPASAEEETIHTVDIRRHSLGEPRDDNSASLVTSLARLKNSLEMGTIGNAVKRTDIVPKKTYEVLGKVSRVVSNPETAQRFLSYVGAQELSENPKIMALRNDPEIQQMISQGRFVELLHNDKIIAAANDPEMVKRFKQFDLEQALDYALQQNQPQ